MKLILASSSPRRAEILRDAGIPFEIFVSHIDETMRPDEPALTMVARLAEAKARGVAAQMSLPPNSVATECIVIGADTAVELDGKIFGKPRDSAHAREMLAALSEKVHQVHTGIFLLRLADGAKRAATETTSVKFAALDSDAIESYVASGEPFDKAGGYAIQERAGRFISGIDGCYFNVVGLPLARLCALMGELGWSGQE